MDKKDKDQSQQPATGQECSGGITPETGKPAGYIEGKTCGQANCLGDFRCEAIIEGRPVTSNYDDLDVKGVIENLVRFGFKGYEKYTPEELVAACVVTEKSSPLHGRLIETLQGYIAAKRSAELTKAIHEFNVTSADKVDSALVGASQSLAALTTALNETRTQVAGAIGTNLQSFITTVSNESKSAGVLTKVLIFVSAGTMLFTGWMAWRTSDLADVTKKSVDLTIAQQQADKQKNKTTSDLLTEIESLKTRIGKLEQQQRTSAQNQPVRKENALPKKQKGG